MAYSIGNMCSNLKAWDVPVVSRVDIDESLNADGEIRIDSEWHIQVGHTYLILRRAVPLAAYTDKHGRSLPARIGYTTECERTRTMQGLRSIAKYYRERH